MAAFIPIAAELAASLVVSKLSVGGIAAALITGGAALLGAYVANELFGADASKQKNAVAIRANYTSTERTIPLIYGTRLVGGNIVFAELGRDGEGGEDKYLWVVLVLGEGEIEGFNQIDVDGVLKDEIYIDGKLIWEYPPGAVDYFLFKGTSSQDLLIDCPLKITDGTRLDKTDKYTDNLRNTAHIILRFRYGAKKDKFFMGVPTIESVIKGIKCLDLRNPGPGKQWTDNPAIIVYDYMSNTRYGAAWEADLFHEDSFKEAATYCDTYEWSLNYAVASQLKLQTIVDTILGHFRGALFWYNDSIYLRFLDLREETSNFSITDEHIARDAKGKAQVKVSQPSRFNIPDGVVVSYINARDNWVTDRVTIGDSFGYIKELDYSGYTERHLAREMGKYSLERERLNRTYSLTLRPDTVALDVNDLVDVTSSELVLNQQLARVKAANIGPNGLIGVTAILEDPTLYDQEYDPDTSLIYEVDFPSISDPPPPVQNIRAQEEVYYNRGRSFTRLNIYFDIPDEYPWFSHVDAYITVQETVPISEDEYIFRLSAPNDFQIDPVEEGEVDEDLGKEVRYYFIRLNSVSTYGITQEDEDAARIMYRVRGVTEEYPPCPTYLDAAVNLTSVDLISNVIPHPDIEGYEIREGSTWHGGIFIIFRLSPSVSFSGVKPGNHKFWLTTKHRNGRYCVYDPPEQSGPVSAEAFIEDPPPGAHLFFEHTIDYTTEGTSTNMTIDTGPPQTIKCSHTGGVLEGTFESIKFDTGNANPNQKMLVYVLFDFNFLGGINSWNVLAPTPNDWNVFAPDPTTWNDLMDDRATAGAAKVEVGIDCATSPTAPYTFSVERMELLSAIVEGTHIRVRIKITDATLASNMVLGAATVKAAYLEDTLLIDA